MTSRRVLGVMLLVATLPVTAQAATFECLVEPYVESDLGSPLPGILEEVLVGRGDTVKKGQPVARLMSAVEQAQLDLLRARLQFAERRVARNEELYRKQMISPHEKDELETDAELLRLEVVRAEEQLRMRTITSPEDGVVVERFLSAGEYVSDDPVLRIAKIHPLRVEVAVPFRYHGKISTGMSGRVAWEAPVADVRNAKVTVVDPVVDAASGTIGVRLELPNPGGRLPAGTKCTVTFDGV